MTSKIIVNTIEADTGISSVTFASNINLANDSSILVSSSGIRLGTGSTIAAPSANEIALSTNSAERLRITSAGSVGIGTDTPGTTKLKIEAGSGTRAISLNAPTNGTYITFETAGTAYADIGAEKGVVGSGSADTPVINARGSRDISFRTNSSERLRITSAGKIGVGVAAPVQMMEIVNTSGTGSQIQLRDTSTAQGNNNGFRVGYNGSGGQLWNFESTYLRFATSNAERLRIDSSGRLLLGLNSSIGGNAIFQVQGSGNKKAQFHQPDSGNCHIQFTNTQTGTSSNNGVEIGLGGDEQAQIWNYYNSYFRIGTNGSERFRITSGGNVNIGDFSQTDSKVTIVDVSRPIAEATLNLQSSTTSGAADTGPVLRFYGHSGSEGRYHASIKGAKENGTSGNTAGYLAFNTRPAGGAMAERLRITSDGYVLKSDTPAFKCKLSGATGANFTGVLVFNSVQYNIGSHYNSSNGRFTAPVDGRYLFAWYTNMERAGGNGSFYAEWYVNNNAQGNRMYSHHSGAWELIGGTVIFDLNANDYVHVQAMTSGNWDGGSYGSYSGYLLG